MLCNYVAQFVKKICAINLNAHTHKDHLYIKTKPMQENAAKMEITIGYFNTHVSERADLLDNK